MTHLAFPEEWSFRGVDLSTYAYMIRRADGVDQLPPLRGENVPVPGVPGRRYASKVADSSRIALALWVNADAAEGGLVEPTAREGARANLDALLAILAPRSVGDLVRTMPDGTYRTASAECVATEPIEDDLGKEAFGLVADFELADPYFYGEADPTLTMISASPTLFTLTNPGTAPAQRILLDFLGPISSPRITNLSIGASFYVEVLVTVEDGKHLLLDVGAWTATNDGAEAIGSVRHSGAFEWFRLLAGDNDLSVTAVAPGGSLTTTFAPPYI